MRAATLVVGGAVALVAVSSSSGNSSLADKLGDANEAPDIVSVAVSDAAAGAVSVRVEVANFETLPDKTQLTLRLDLDSDEQTGVGGYELAVRYSSDGTTELLRYDGIDLAPIPATGVSASFSAGVLTYSLARALFGGSTSVGLSVVGSRTQTVGAAQIVSSDLAPERGENIYSPPSSVSFADPRSDEDAAPDITTAEVSDSPDGTLTFRIVTANYPSLTADKEVGVIMALAGRPPLDDELFLTFLGGDSTLLLDREERGLAVPDEAPTRASAHYENGVLVVSIRRSELEGTAAFRLGIVSADIVGPDEGAGDGHEGDLEAVDVAPDGLVDGKQYTYRLVNPPPVRLSTDSPAGSPVLPIAGRSFAVSVVVRRSDAFQVVRTGVVACRATIGRQRVPASGRFVRGSARCALHVPRTSVSATLRGKMTIRSGGKTVTTRFSFPVREHGGG